MTDKDGNIVWQHEVNELRQVISESVCKEVARILEEGVSGDGGSKNAYVAGYRIAAKTGTSEKKDLKDAEGNLIDGKYICSTVAYAPADDPQYITLIMVDQPTKGTLYGSVVAAPYVGNVMATILPYLGVEAVYTDAELAKKLLGTKELSLAEISAVSGFADVYYFSKLFKKETGLSPTEYRKEKTHS
jgi:stage V sporulation protein D (sporulation-specific penicillin-binding protein)